MKKIKEWFLKLSLFAQILIVSALAFLALISALAFLWTSNILWCLLMVISTVLVLISIIPWVNTANDE